LAWQLSKIFRNQMQRIRIFMPEKYLPAKTGTDLDELYQNVPESLFLETPESAVLAIAYGNQKADPADQLKASGIAKKVNAIFPNLEKPLSPTKVGMIVHHPEAVLSEVQERWLQSQQESAEQTTAAVMASAQPQDDAQEPSSVGRNPFLAKAMLGAMELAAHIKGDDQAEQQAHQANAALADKDDYQNLGVRAYDAPGKFMRGLAQWAGTAYQATTDRLETVRDQAMAIDQTGKQKLREMADSIQETTRAWSERAGEDTRMLQSLFYARECGQEGSKSLADADAQRSATIAALFESAERG
jgi:hypothetical protein